MLSVRALTLAQVSCLQLTDGPYGTMNEEEEEEEDMVVPWASELALCA